MLRVSIFSDHRHPLVTRQSKWRFKWHRRIRYCGFIISSLLIYPRLHWCPKGDLNPHPIARYGF